MFDKLFSGMRFSAVDLDFNINETTTYNKMSSHIKQGNVLIR